MKVGLDRRSFLRLGTAGLALGAVPRSVRSTFAAETLTFQASWFNDAEFTGFFVAIDKGYYLDERLELTYLSGGPEIIPEKSLISGEADIALTTPETTVAAIRNQGAPLKIIGTLYQKNPIGVVSLTRTGINSPRDLIGKTIAVPFVNIISVEAMLRLNDIDRKTVTIVPYSYDPVPLIRGEIDASIDFTTNMPFAIEQAGGEASSFLLYDFGFTTYNTVVVTEDILVAKRPQIVAWLRASRRGWEENLVDPTVWPPRFADSWFKDNGRTIENEIYFNTAQKPLIVHPDGIFAMDEQGIERNIEALFNIGIHAAPEMFDTTLIDEV